MAVIGGGEFTAIDDGMDFGFVEGGDFEGLSDLGGGREDGPFEIFASFSLFECAGAIRSEVFE